MNLRTTFTSQPLNNKYAANFRFVSCSLTNHRPVFMPAGQVRGTVPHQDNQITQWSLIAQAELT